MRTMVLAGQQVIEFGHMEQQQMRWLQQAQNTIAELQHDIDRLNNTIDPIHPLDEEEDLDMLIEDDGWEEVEVEPEEDVVPMEDNDDEPMSDIDSDHSDEQSSHRDQLVALDAFFCDLK